MNYKSKYAKIMMLGIDLMRIETVNRIKFNLQFGHNKVSNNLNSLMLPNYYISLNRRCVEM